jgi:hypothetical protein
MYILRIVNERAKQLRIANEQLAEQLRIANEQVRIANMRIENVNQTNNLMADTNYVVHFANELEKQYYNVEDFEHHAETAIEESQILTLLRETQFIETRQNPLTIIHQSTTQIQNKYINCNFESKNSNIQPNWIIETSFTKEALHIGL